MARLADDEIEIRLDDVIVRLRPSLRAAYRLERKYGGFDAILKALLEGSLTVAADIIRESSTWASPIPNFLDEIEDTALGPKFSVIFPPLMQHLNALVGVDDDDASKATGEGEGTKRITFAEYHTRLYRIATGWLGWSPDQAWTATPAEILEAQQGYIERMKLIHGSGEGEGSPKQISRDEFIKKYGGKAIRSAGY